jgi:peptide/nickel transport system permease protein
VLPNTVPLIVTLLTVEMGVCAVVESALSFVGETIASDYPTWGSMIASGRAVIHEGWWLLLFPSLSLIATVLSFNLLGDGLRRIIDPVHR